MAERKPDLEFIGLTTNVFNVYKALASCTTEMKKMSIQAKVLNIGIYSAINVDINEGNHSLKTLRDTNIEIEAILKRLDKLDTAKLNRTRDVDWLTKQISKTNLELEELMKRQASIQKIISSESKKGADQEKVKVGWNKALMGLTSQYFSGLGEILEVWKDTRSIGLVFFTLVKQIVQIFNQLDTAAFEFRQEMGFTRNYTGDIDKFARAGATSMAQLSVTGKKMYEAAAGISKELYSSMNITQEMLNNVALISTQLGVSAQATAELLKNLGIVSRSAASTQQDTLFFAASLSEAAGTPLVDVMNDISNATKNAYQFISRSSITMVKAAVEAKRMGTSITSAAQSSEFLLKFTSSVNAEMEASVLLGKSINLQKARELAYHRDIRGLNAEILRIIKETNFENLDPFQQNAVAEALGKSTGELAQMAQAERERLNMVRAMTPEQKKQYNMYQEMMAGGEKQKKDYAEIAKNQLMQLSNQTRLTAISASWNKIMMQLAKIFLPLIDVTLKFIADHFNIIFFSVTGIYSAWKLMTMTIKAGGLRLAEFSRGIARIGEFFNIRWLENFGRGLIKYGLSLRKTEGLIGDLFKGILAPIKTIASKVFLILAPLMFAWNIFKEIKKILNDPSLMGTKGFFAFNGKLILRAIGAIVRALWNTINDLFLGLPGLIIRGIAAVSNALFNSLLDPFKRVWSWLGKVFLGESPSQLGLMIVKGIVAVHDMIVNALLFPFKKAWQVIQGLPIISKIFGGRNVGANVVPEGRAPMTVEKPTTDMATRKSAEMPAAVNGMSDELTKRMSDVVDAINGLREDMKNGKLTANVYIDSQKLDAAVGRRIAYTGQLV